MCTLFFSGAYSVAGLPSMEANRGRSSGSVKGERMDHASCGGGRQTAPPPPPPVGSRKKSKTEAHIERHHTYKKN